MARNKVIIICGLFVFCVCCGKNSRTKQIENIVQEWVGKTIKIPADANCFVYSERQKTGVCDSLLSSEYKLLLFVDSSGCSDCRLQLGRWKLLIEEADSVFGKKLGFLFFFQPKDMPEMRYILNTQQFDYPVFIDLKGEINKLNGFPRQELYQCFLLDDNNKVLSIGNPLYNRGIWDLYKKIITENKI